MSKEYTVQVVSDVLELGGARSSEKSSPELRCGLKEYLVRIYLPINMYVGIYVYMYAKNIYVRAENLTACHGDAMEMYHCARQNIMDFSCTLSVIATGH